MSQVQFEDAVIDLNEGESVLDGLLRSGIDMAFGCKSGVCQSCLVEVTEGAPPAAAQKGLNDAQTALGYMLSCQCRPEQAIRVKRIDASTQMVSSEVLDKQWLNENVLRLRVRSELNYRAGQYITLWRNETLARSYSLASHPESDDFLEFHIKVIPDGQLSPWLANEVMAGNRLSLQGPMGQCFYTATSPDQPLLMAAIGTGLAPIYGILKDALSQGHYGPIDVVLGARESNGFYLLDELADLAHQHSNLTIHVVSQADLPEDQDNIQSVQADLYDYCNELWPSLKGYRVFLCGADSFVKKLRKQSFLAGAGMGDISADVFIPAGG